MKEVIGYDLRDPLDRAEVEELTGKDNMNNKSYDKRIRRDAILRFVLFVTSQATKKAYDQKGGGTEMSFNDFMLEQAEEYLKLKEVTK